MYTSEEGRDADKETRATPLVYCIRKSAKCGSTNGNLHLCLFALVRPMA